MTTFSNIISNKIATLMMFLYILALRSHYSRSQKSENGLSGCRKGAKLIFSHYWTPIYHQSDYLFSTRTAVAFFLFLFYINLFLFCTWIWYSTYFAYININYFYIYGISAEALTCYLDLYNWAIEGLSNWAAWRTWDLNSQPSDC